MIKTYEIDLDDKLVEDSSKIFESLGSDIDSAIKIFLTQAILRKGFPFEVAVPDDKTEEIKTENMIENEALENLSKKDKAYENQSASELSQAENQSSSSKKTADKNISIIPDSYKLAELKKDWTELNSLNQTKSENLESENQTQKDSGENQNEPQKISESKTSQNSAESAKENFEISEDVQKQNPQGEQISEDEDETAPENLFAQWNEK